MSTKDNSLIATRIRLAREKKNYNQAKLALESKITPAAISQFEAGERAPSSPILRRLASALAVSTDYLLGNTDDINLQDLVQDKAVQSFYRDFKELSTEDQKIIEAQIEFLKSRKN
jgi:transcriptional regulator with XRE-family HTH domain